MIAVIRLRVETVIESVDQPHVAQIIYQYLHCQREHFNLLDKLNNLNQFAYHFFPFLVEGANNFKVSSVKSLQNASISKLVVRLEVRFAIGDLSV